jgi:hypothetical protein
MSESEDAPVAFTGPVAETKPKRVRPRTDEVRAKDRERMRRRTAEARAKGISIRTGQPLVSMKGVDAASRVMSRISVDANGCWLSSHTRGSHGHARLWVDGHLLYAHKVIWESIHGPVLDGHHLVRICGGPAWCVRPEHWAVAPPATA